MRLPAEGSDEADDQINLVDVGKPSAGTTRQLDLQTVRVGSFLEFCDDELPLWR
jgi:hypothetical protein